MYHDASQAIVLVPCRMFNARSETVPEKSVFNRLLSSKRCVVLLNGFYEWAQVSYLCSLHLATLHLAKLPIDETWHLSRDILSRNLRAALCTLPHYPPAAFLSCLWLPSCWQIATQGMPVGMRESLNTKDPSCSC